MLFCKDSANKWNDKNACEKIAIFAQKKQPGVAVMADSRLQVLFSVMC